METGTECSSYSRRTGSSSKWLRRLRTETLLPILSSSATSCTCTTTSCWDRHRRSMPSNVLISPSQISRLITRWRARSVTVTKPISKQVKKRPHKKLILLWPTTLWLKTQPPSSRCSHPTEWSPTTSRVLIRIKKAQFCTSAPCRLENRRWRRWTQKRKKNCGPYNRSKSVDSKCYTIELWKRLAVTLPSHSAAPKNSRKLSTIRRGLTPMMRRLPPTTTSDVTSLTQLITFHIDAILQSKPSFEYSLLTTSSKLFLVNSKCCSSNFTRIFPSKEWSTCTRNYILTNWSTFISWPKCSSTRMCTCVMW